MLQQSEALAKRLYLGDDEPRAWRERMLGGLLWTSALAFACVTPWTFVEHLYGSPGAWMFAGFGLLLLATAVARRRLPYWLCAGVVLGSTSVATVYALARTGFAPNVFTSFIFVVVVATLLLGVRGGIIFAGLQAASLAVIPALHHSGRIQRVESWALLLDSGRPESALRVGVVFVVLSMASVLAISYLLRRGERLLLERTRSLEQLANEQAEKERIRNDLLLREAAFRKAAELEILARLSGSMAHDFNNALLVVFAALDQFSRAELPGNLREAVEAMRVAATQAASTTRQLRAFGPHRAARAPTRVLLAQSVQRLGTLLACVLPSNVELCLDLAGADDLVILGDEGEVQRMLTNLVLNARDAMRDGGRVVIGVERATLAGEPCARIEVRDDGAGMSDEVQRRLFEPFFTTKGGAGTGLGLASVRQLVEAAGGTIGVRSQLGAGSTVSVCWPLVDDAPAMTTRPITASAPDGRGISVLLVDDDRQVRPLLALGLRRLGFTVVEAADGNEGLLIVRRHREPLHVLCSDCIMPGAPLRELRASFLAAFPEGRVLVCSGYAPEEAGVTSGSADTFLSKPFGIEELARHIVELHRRPRAAPASMLVEGAA